MTEKSPEDDGLKLLQWIRAVTPNHPDPMFGDVVSKLEEAINDSIRLRTESDNARMRAESELSIFEETIGNLDTHYDTLEAELKRVRIEIGKDPNGVSEAHERQYLNEATGLVTTFVRNAFQTLSTAVNSNNPAIGENYTALVIYPDGAQPGFHAEFMDRGTLEVFHSGTEASGMPVVDDVFYNGFQELLKNFLIGKKQEQSVPLPIPGKSYQATYKPIVLGDAHLGGLYMIAEINPRKDSKIPGWFFNQSKDWQKYLEQLDSNIRDANYMIWYNRNELKNTKIKSEMLNIGLEEDRNIEVVETSDFNVPEISADFLKQLGKLQHLPTYQKGTGPNTWFDVLQPLIIQRICNANPTSSFKMVNEGKYCFSNENRAREEFIFEFDGKAFGRHLATVVNRALVTFKERDVEHPIEIGTGLATAVQLAAAYFIPGLQTLEQQYQLKLGDELTMAAPDIHTIALAGAATMRKDVATRFTSPLREMVIETMTARYSENGVLSPEPGERYQGEQFLKPIEGNGGRHALWLQNLNSLESFCDIYSATMIPRVASEILIACDGYARRVQNEVALSPQDPVSQMSNLVDMCVGYLGHAAVRAEPNPTNVLGQAGFDQAWNLLDLQVPEFHEGLRPTRK